MCPFEVIRICKAVRGKHGRVEICRFEVLKMCKAVKGKHERNTNFLVDCNK